MAEGEKARRKVLRALRPFVCVETPTLTNSLSLNPKAAYWNPVLEPVEIYPRAGSCFWRRVPTECLNLEP